MKGVFLLIYLLFFLPLHGLYNGNPFAPDIPELGVHISNENWWGIKIAYLLDDTFWKGVNFSDPQKVLALGSEKMIGDFSGKCHLKKNSAVLTFNIIDRVELFTHLGTMNMNITSPLKDQMTLLYQSKNQFFWGVGGRVILVYWEEVVMGVNALYQSASLKMNSLSVNQNPLPPKGANISYKEWQVGLSFSRAIGIFVPYIGLAYASMDSRLNHLPGPSASIPKLESQKIDNREPFIVCLGVGLTKGQAFAINIESRMVGEQAIALFADLRF